MSLAACAATVGARNGKRAPATLRTVQGMTGPIAPTASTRSTQHNAWVQRACALIDSADTPIPLTELAQACGVSPHHLHRVFKAQTGLTPKQYAQARRSEAAQRALQTEARVTDAVYAAGFNASSRFYEQAPQMLGMSAKHYRQGGAGEAIRFAVAQTRLGALLVAASERGVCAISLGADADALVHELQQRFPQATLSADDAQFDAWVALLVGWVQGTPHAANTPHTPLDDLPLDLRGTLFQRQVWQVLRGIAPGQTLSYAQVAQRLGRPTAARAVAQACAANTLALAVPCHRVVRSDGQLSGYRWGVDRKRALLLQEQAGGLSGGHAASATSLA